MEIKINLVKSCSHMKYGICFYCKLGRLRSFFRDNTRKQIVHTIVSSISTQQQHKSYTFRAVYRWAYPLVQIRKFFTVLLTRTSKETKMKLQVLAVLAAVASAASASSVDQLEARVRLLEEKLGKKKPLIFFKKEPNICFKKI